MSTIYYCKKKSTAKIKARDYRRMGYQVVLRKVKTSPFKYRVYVSR